MSLTYSGAEPQPSLAWQFQSSNVDSVTGLTPSAQVSPGPAQLQGSAALVTNAPTSNTAVYFPGTSGNYMNLGAAGPTTFNTTTSNTFVEAWVYFNAVAGFNSRIYGRYFDPTNNGDYNIRTSGAGLGFTNGSVVVSHQTAMQTGVWTHIAFSLMTNGTANVFVNGVVNSTGGSITVAYTPAHITLIGGGPTSLTNGYIRDLRVVQGGVVPVATFTPGAAPFSYASPSYVANMGTTVFTLLGQFVTYPSGKYGSSIIFRNPSTPTQTNYISYNNKFQYQVDNGFSVSSWVKIISLPSINESYAFEFNTSDGAAYISIYCGVQPSGNFFLQYYDGIDFKGLTLVNPVVLNKWYNVVCSVGSGRVDFYLDNVNKRSITYTPRGRSIITGYLGRGCDCELDDLRIYNTALTSTQVQSVYSSQGAPAPSRAMPLPKLAWDFNGTTTDYVTGLTPANYSGASANAITYVNAAIYGTGKYGQSINVYNTSNAFYTNTLQYRLPSAIGPPYSLSFWAKQNTIWVPGNGTFQSLLIRNVSSPVNSFVMKLPSYSLGNSSLESAVLNINNIGSNFTGYLTGGTGKWFFVCISVLPQAATMYFWSPSYSSIQSSTVTTTSTYATCGTDIATCISGYTEGNTTNQPFNGELDDLRIFDRALTSAQVQAVFNQQGVPGRGVTDGPQAKIFLGPLLRYPTATGTEPTNDGTKLTFTRASSQFLNFGSQTFDMTQGFSATCRFAFFGTAVAYERIFDLGKGENNDNLILCRNNLTQQISFYFQNGVTQYFASSTNSFTQGQVNTLTAIYTHSPVSIRIVLNGVTTTATPGAAATTPRTLTICYVGESNWASDAYSNLDIYSLNIYNRALTPSELAGPPAPSPWSIMTGTPLFSQLSQAASSSAVGAFSLRAVNGTSVKAVQVRPQAQFPPAAMTADTTSLTGYAFGGTGSYVASASLDDVYIDQGFKAFDNNLNTYWHANYPIYTAATGIYLSGNARASITASIYAGEWLQIKMPTPVLLLSYSLVGRSTLETQRSPRKFWILGSNDDGVNWSLVDTQTNINTWASPQVAKTFTISNPGTTYFNTFRIVVNEVGNLTTGGSLQDSVHIATWNLVGSPSSQDFYADRLGNLLTAPVVGQPLARWLGGATGYVATWYDQSGAGNHMNQPTAANQPILSAATKPASLIFTGTEYFQNTVPFTFNFGSGAFTLRYVVSNNTGGVILYKANGSDFVWSGNEKKFWLGNGTTTETSRGGFPSQVGNSEAYVLASSAIGSTKTSVVHKATSKTAVPIYVNGTIQSVTTNLNMGNDPGNFLYFGRGGNASNYIGNLHEIQVFSTAFSDTDRLVLEN